ncbi:glycosyltransferase family 4 protein [Alphaproteobacteria bacterium]|nr:glycosyltransferase family 4 protein [Alphaproteobacteria bacterium]
MKKNLRILQVLPALEMGGVERGTIDVALFLKEKGHFPVVASRGGCLVSHLRKHGIIHEYLPLHSKNPVTIWLNIGRLVSLIKRHQIQAIHARSRAPAWSAYFAAKKAGIPFLTTFHGTHPFQNKAKQLYNSVMTRGKRVIAVSKFIAKDIQKKYGTSSKKISLIYRGVDLDVFNPDKVTESRMEALMTQMQLPDDKYILLLPGRVTRWKGHEVLLDAASRLKRDDFICLFVGSAKNQSYVTELEDQAKLYGMRDRLFIISNCKDMPALYALSTATVCPSTRPEPFGRTAAEAGAMGCPVIGSDYGGTKEIVVDEKTGFLFPPEDSRVLADKIDQALNMTQEERKAMKAAATAHIRRNFDNKTMLTKTLKVYEEILS